MQAQANATGMPAGIVTPLNTNLLATPPPPPFAGAGTFGLVPTDDGPAVGAPPAPSGMSDRDIALVGVALGLGVLVLLVGIVAALLTIRHHFIHLERHRTAAPDPNKPSNASSARRKVRASRAKQLPLGPPLNRDSSHGVRISTSATLGLLARQGRAGADSVVNVSSSLGSSGTIR